MAQSNLSMYLLILSTYMILPSTLAVDKFVPLVVTTWDYQNATQIGDYTIYFKEELSLSNYY